MTTTTNTLLVEMRFKNARLYDAIRDHAVPEWRTPKKSAAGAAGMARGQVKRFCAFYELSLAAVYDLLNLKTPPLGRFAVDDGDGYSTPRWRVRPVCQRLAAVLGRDMGWLFPLNLYAGLFAGTVLARGDPDRLEIRYRAALTAPARPLLTPTTPDRAFAELEQTHAVHDVVADVLRPRHAQVLRLRFGLDDGIEHTYEEIGAIIGVSKSRAEMITKQALTKLRRPRATKRLAPVLDFEPDDERDHRVDADE